MKKIVVICGPTAVGKSALAMKLAQEQGGEIIAADSAQVFKELDIGTAKPTLLDRRSVPHHLIDVVSPGEHFDASRYVELADRSIRDITGRGKLPIVVGGCGLYIRILLYGLCEAPPQDETLRSTFALRVEQQGLESLYRELQQRDPVVADKLHPNDRTRIIRALEVLELTGTSIQKFQRQHGFLQPRYEARQIGLNCDRAELHRRIEKRVDWMIASGWAEEVRELLKFYRSDSQALQSIGYKQLVQYLRGTGSLADAVAAIKKQTRQYARRQLTWFRRDKKIEWMNPKTELKP